MEGAPTLQERIFQEIKANLPRQFSLVHEVADLLNVSTDSAYRRLRGETELTLFEAKLLSNKFGISLDGFAGTRANAVTFYHDGFESRFNLGDHFQSLLSHFQKVEAAKEKEVIYFSREVPIFHLFHVPEVLAFKLFFWRTTAEGMSGQEKFSRNTSDSELAAIGREILHTYLRLPTIEILSPSALDNTLRQIAYYYEAGYFKNTEEALLLVDKLDDLMDHLREMAARGYKFAYGARPMGTEGNLKLHYNEVIAAENTVWLKADGKVMVFLEHNYTHYMWTADPAFCEFTRASLESIMSKSTMLSTVSERERNKFFMRMKRAVERVRKQMKDDWT